jgi:aspartyl-tRNA(Asn)/glutamyl-tRNA(Gln) amidotransferase subunit A
MGPRTLPWLSAAELTTRYRQGAFTPLDVAQALATHIAEREPALHALYAYDAASLLQQAQASTQRWQAGQALGALDGVPVTIKENIATRGTPVPLGCAAMPLVPAPADAPPAARLREAGAVIVAKTTMPDLGMLSSGLSSFHALSRNPWDPRLTPGGSSAGAAAAAAAGYGPLHLGTDIGGSIRLPAGWCGVVGFKPSAGRVPIHPPYTGRVAGPLARSVADAALAMAVLSRPDVRDPTRLPPQDIAWAELGDEADVSLHGLRIGLLLDAGWGLPVDAATQAAVSDAARRLQAAGAHVEPLAPFTTREMVDGLDRFWRLRAWLEIQALPADRRDRVLPYIRAWAEPASGYSGTQVFHGQAQMAALRDAAARASEAFDFIVSPTSPVPAFAAELASPLHDPTRPFEHIAFTLPWNMGEQPAITLPCGMAPGDGAPLPIGLQISGQRHDDAGVLRLARAWERLRAPLPRWPGQPDA